MVEDEYYVVESSFVERVVPGTTGQLIRDGSWADYPDRWEVLSGGRPLEKQEKALAKAKQLLEPADARDAGQGMSLVRVRCRRAIRKAVSRIHSGNQRVIFIVTLCPSPCRTA